jgi:hypothetical protein
MKEISKRILSKRWPVRLAAPAAIGLVAVSAAIGLTVPANGAPLAKASTAAVQVPPMDRGVAVAAAGTTDAVRAYWTKAKMASARSADLVAGGQGKAVIAGNTASGKPGVAGGYVPASVANPTPAQASAPSVKSTGVLPADGGFPGPNTTFDWYPKYRTYPVSTIGKLFFTEPSGEFVCTAAATYGGGSLDTVWTAGHCVGPGGGQAYYTNWLFCPSYLEPGNENPAVGCWSWASAQQTSGWYFNGYYSADYAVLFMQSTGDIIANHVVSAVGGLGFAWNWGRDQHWFDFGYPAGSPYDGNAIVVTAAEHRYDVTNPGGDPGPQDNSIGSAQTPGFSGGPWILSFGGTGSDPQTPHNWINSDNSYYFTSGGPGGGNEYGQEIQGPYFDTNACNFWKGETGYTGTC